MSRASKAALGMQRATDALHQAQESYDSWAVEVSEANAQVFRVDQDMEAADALREPEPTHPAEAEAARAPMENEKLRMALCGLLE